MNKEIENSRHKLVFVITKSNFGGAQKYVYDLASSLPVKDFDIVVLLGGQGILKEKLEEKGIRTIVIRSLQRDVSVKKEFQVLKELFSILRSERPDILHLNSSKAGGLGALIGRILRIKKIVFTAHAWAFNEKRNAISRALISLAHWSTVVFSHETIAVSHAVKEDIEHFPGIKNKIRVIHLGINQPEFLGKIESQKSLGLPPKRSAFNLGTIAELHPVKGLAYSIDALSFLRDKNPEAFERVNYSIIGDGEQVEWLRRHIAKRNLIEKVRLLGWKDAAAHYLKAFDLFVLPSLSEAFGYVLLEAGLAGVPIITSNVGGIPEIIEDNTTGRLFSPANAREIMRSIELSLQAPVERKQMALALARRIKSEFSIEKMIEATIDTYLKNG